MRHYAYVNGRYVLHSQACIHIEDRGFQFADGVYEVIAIKDSRFLDREGHLTRLARSLRELRIECPVAWSGLPFIMDEVRERNRVTQGIAYLQVTRGVAPRNFLFPPETRATLVVMARSLGLVSQAVVEKGARVITLTDIRWKRRDIKSIALLPQVLGKQQAFEANAFEGWMLDEQGYITEGCSSNAWIVTEQGVVVTRRPNHEILNGVTRLSLLDIIKLQGYPIESRRFSLEEAYQAKEAFLTSATTFVLPIIQIDDRVIGDGSPGALASSLRQAYLEKSLG